MEYDGYVVSTIEHSRNIDGVNHTDIGFVKNVLSPKLEAEKPHFILYLEYRDPSPGCEKLHNVQQAVDKSRRIIIVLTENFLKVCPNAKHSINHLIKCLINRLYERYHYLNIANY